MENIVKIIVLLTGFLNASDTLRIDLPASQIEWTGRKVTGEHSGYLNLSDGWILMEGPILSGGRFKFDMTSITNTDIDSPEWKLKLENHLKSADFFLIDSFPHCVLNIKGNLPMVESDSKKEDNILKGDLSIRGITHEILIPYQLTKTDSNFTASGLVNIDRTLYNVRYKSGKFFDELGDKMIYDEFSIHFQLQTKPGDQ